eukprot:365693-Chlamydomonas_euryale.AAC.23
MRQLRLPHHKASHPASSSGKAHVCPLLGFMRGTTSPPSPPLFPRPPPFLFQSAHLCPVLRLHVRNRQQHDDNKRHDDGDAADDDCVADDAEAAVVQVGKEERHAHKEGSAGGMNMSGAMGRWCMRQGEG